MPSRLSEIYHLKIMSFLLYVACQNLKRYIIWVTLDVERANVFDVKVAKYVSLSIVRMYVRKYDTCHYPCQKFLQSK